MSKALSKLLEKYWELEKHDKNMTQGVEAMRDAIQEAINECPCNKGKPGTVVLCDRCLNLRAAMGVGRH